MSSLQSNGEGRVGHEVRLHDRRRCWLLALFVILTAGRAFAQCMSPQLLTDSNPEALATFGRSVSVSGDTAVVGVPKEDCLGVGIDCGSASVYRFDGLNWIKEQDLTASDAQDDDLFGVSVSVDGDTIVVGAPDVGCETGDSCGAVYVFRFNGSTWVQEQKLTASDAEAADWFGRALALDGDTILVGARGDACPGAAGDECGAAYVFRFNGIDWEEEQKLTASDPGEDDRFGWSVSIDADTAVVGAYLVGCAAGTWCGAAYVFRFDGTTWLQPQKLTASDIEETGLFGNAVSVISDTIMVGAPGTDCTAGFACGAVYVFRSDGLNWFEEQKLTPFDQDQADWFGTSVSVSGHTAVIGAPYETCAGDVHCGSAYIFRFDETSWQQELKLVAAERAPEDWFGNSVAVSGDLVVVGARGDDCAAGQACGSVYMYQPCGPPIPAASTWGLVLMTMLMFTAGTLFYRHRLLADTL